MPSDRDFSELQTSIEMLTRALGGALRRLEVVEKQLDHLARTGTFLVPDPEEKK